MRASLKSWLLDLGVVRPEQSPGARIQRVWLLVLFLAVLGVPAFAWVQYRQAHNLERLTSQDFTGFEWDAVKLEFRTLQMHNALREAVQHADSADARNQASMQYNLMVAQVQLMAQRAPIQGVDDEPSFKTAMSYATAFIRQADPLLEEEPPQANVPANGQALQALLPQAEALRTQMYQLLVAAHDLRLERSKQFIDEVARLNLYFAALSVFVVVLGAGWALSAVRNLKLSAARQEELAKKVEENSFSASHDFLTNLANRRLLLDQLDHVMARSKRHNTCGAIIMIDLDNFKPVNDRYGHNAGDLLLVEVARRIKNGVRDVDTVARVGGDEFVVLLSQVDGEPEGAGNLADAVAQKLLAAVSVPFALAPLNSQAQHDAVSYRCTASMGVSVFSKDTTDVDELLRQADAAMYRAKQAGGNRVEISG